MIQPWPIAFRSNLTQFTPVCPLTKRRGSTIPIGLTRALCNGKTLAFQAKDTGSIPVARSKSLENAFLLNGLTE